MPDKRLYILLPLTIARLYTKVEATAHFISDGDPSPDVFACCGQWANANANDGEAVWSHEAAVAGKGKTRGKTFRTMQAARKWAGENAA